MPKARLERQCQCNTANEAFEQDNDASQNPDECYLRKKMTMHHQLLLLLLAGVDDAAKTQMRYYAWRAGENSSQMGQRQNLNRIGPQRCERHGKRGFRLFHGLQVPFTVFHLLSDGLLAG